MSILNDVLMEALSKIQEQLISIGCDVFFWVDRV